MIETAPLLCPSCHVSGSPAVCIGGLGVCSNCGQFFAVDGTGLVRKATGADADRLGDEDLKTFRQQRGRFRKMTR